MNKARWEGLPDDLKAVFDAHCGEEWLRTVAEIWRASDDGGIALAVENGNEHVVLTEEEMAAFTTVLAPVVDGWIEEHAGDFDAGGAGGRGAGGAVGPAVLSSEAYEGGGEPPPPATRTAAGAAIVAGRALVGAARRAADARARGDDRGERGARTSLTGRPFAADYELVKHVIAVAIFMFLPYCQIIGVQRHRRHLHRAA